MAKDAQEKARRDLRRSRSDFERRLQDAHASRRESFQRAQEAGLSLREIAKEVGLHWTRVGEILREK
jgi:DNA-directed RNA polymerase specialized sigma24 family protein